MTTVKRLASCEESLLKTAVDFHGHLGPYLVLGIRMGLVAVRVLKPKHLHELSATVWTGKAPPQSCLLDGVQVSSRCTLGKANIRIREARRTRAEFRKSDGRVVIRLSEKVIKLLSTVAKHTPQSRLDDLALSLFRKLDRQLFVIEF